MKLASIASNRLEVLLGRIVGTALILNGIEPLVNGLGQLSQLNSLGLGLLVLFLGTSLFAGISGWTPYAAQGFTVHGIAVLLILLATPFGFEPFLDPGQRPWVWWALGLGAVFFAIGVRNNLRYLFIVAMGAGWFGIFGFAMGAQQAQLALLDALYVVVFSLAIVSLTDLVRDGATRVDVANSEAISRSLEQARVDAIERERQRLDALVHDQVLHSLLLAAKAETSEDQAAVVRSADAAIAALTRVKEGFSQNTSSHGLFQAIEKAAKRLDSRIDSEIVGADSLLIPASAAEALTEATMQALDNAIQHSDASSIQLSMRASGGLVDFTIRDDGVGFRLDRVSRSRIGIRTSILARMRSVGGEAKVHSSPNAGTEVSLRWSNV